MNIVRENLMTRKGYTPYCGNKNCRFHMPRTSFIGGQFQCACGWRSSYEPEFIKAYLDKWTPPKREIPPSKYVGIISEAVSSLRGHGCHVSLADDLESVAEGLEKTPVARAVDSFGNDLIEQELVSIVLRLARYSDTDRPGQANNKLRALDYLRRKKLMPSPLRAAQTVVQSGEFTNDV